ncbi:hypothetical protein [Pleomorphochaeta sp. DL1XJH-081]|uniref:hypothetical protein n=1 Tax=Pleomorphochaeta sp. DL1XJH-081 TaxID=3409690 RepID=UPI003BB7402A
MFGKTHQNMLRMYRVNPENHRVVIDIALDRYLDYFHEWDNSVFRKRDLHPELAEFLDLCSEEIPLRKKLELSFWIKNRKEEDIEKENVLMASYRNYYESQLHMVGRNLNRHFKFALVLFLIAIGFIALYFVVSKFEEGHLLSKIMVEGVLIGAWVFTWESFHMLFFETLEPMKRRRELKRFLDAKIGFRFDRKS